MLNPEVWTFSPPVSHFTEKRGNIEEGKSDLPSSTRDFHFAHVVTVVFPNSPNIPKYINECLSVDCEYYKLENIPLSELLEQEFIDDFVKEGSLTALSIGTLIDTDDCVCVTPDGVLVLSLNKETYQGLGLEGKVSHFTHRTKDKYIAQLNLKDAELTLSKYFKRIKQSLSKQKFDFILAWEPADYTVCPSSVAKYLSLRGCAVSECSPKCEAKILKSMLVPKFNDDDSVTPAELVEWLGTLGLDRTVQLEEISEYMSSYKCPEPNELCPNVKYEHWRGLFTVHQIQRLYQALINYIRKQTDVPWISMYVQGFSDTPVVWGLMEHHFYTSGDNGFVIFLKPNKYLLCTQKCSYKAYKHEY